LTMLAGGNVIARAAGDSQSAALDEFGRLWMWGYNGYGQLGTGTTMQNLQPVQVIIPEFDGGRITQVALGEVYSLAVDNSGGLWGWGYSGDGQLARESYNELVPVKIPSRARISTVAAGRGHVLALDENKNLWAFGRNGSGQLGTGNSDYRSHIPEPVGKLDDGAALADIVLFAGNAQITVGEAHPVSVGKVNITNPFFNKHEILLGDTSVTFLKSGTSFVVGGPLMRAEEDFIEVDPSVCKAVGEQKVPVELIDITGRSLASDTVSIQCSPSINISVVIHDGAEVDVTNESSEDYRI